MDTVIPEGHCEICGAPMPEGETMFRFHGYSGPCPLPPLPRVTSPLVDKLRARHLSTSSAVMDGDGGIYHGQLFGEASTLIAQAAAEIERLEADNRFLHKRRGELVVKHDQELTRIYDILAGINDEVEVGDDGYARFASVNDRDRFQAIVSELEAKHFAARNAGTPQAPPLESK